MKRITERKCPYCHKIIDRMECERVVTEYGHVLHSPDLTEDCDLQVYMDCVEKKDSEDLFFCTHCGEILARDEEEALRIMLLK